MIVEEAKCATLVRGELEEIRFKKWTKVGHLRRLYIRADVNGKLISRVLINGEAMLNVVSYSTVKKLGKSREDLKETNMTMFNFTGGSTPALEFQLPN